MKSLRELSSLSGRVACVTGGAGHIGSTMADALAELGAAVVIVDLEAERCSDVAADLAEKWSTRTLPLRVDLEDESALRTIAPAVLEQFGRLDVLINSAALVGTSRLEGWAVPLQDQSAETWRRALEINLTAPFVLAQTCAEALAASGHGSIVNVLSIYGLVGPDFSLYEGTPVGNPAAYGASKGGLLQLTRYLATALAPAVRVNAITPGGVWRNQAQAFHARYNARTPLARMATEEDFKGAIAYLASDLSNYVTGHNLVVDGGWTAW
jgi:NAD(P)-dependent dehydrogenase (short-subunit alcohol dehydrogenase family)